MTDESNYCMDLNSKTNDPFPENYNLLLQSIDDTISFIKSILETSVRNNYNVILISNKEKTFKNMRYKNLNVITSSNKENCKNSIIKIKQINSLTNLTQVGLSISEILNKKNTKEKNIIILDDIDSIIEQKDVKTVFRFFHTLNHKVKTVDGFIISMISSEKNKKYLKPLFDKTIKR